MTTHDPVYLKDYRPPPYRITTVKLVFDLFEDKALVRSRLEIVRNEHSSEKDAPLFLHGQELKLLSLTMDGRALGPSEFSINEQGLTVHHGADSFALEIETEIHPEANTALEGLYRSSGNFCTQCEAEGFRKITYYQDRPDVLASFQVTIQADREKYPVLLANGNLVKSGELAGNRHYAQWQDPFPKPSYLFALVAGDLVKIEDFFTTASGRKVALQIYVQEHNRDRCDHAMASLIKAMRWDEETFGLEYDLDQYMIVAVDDFNMGAMENKGLNVFNSKFVLAKAQTATDSDYEYIEAVIAHEYFHNWTGNRVTCRDWFQLSLKEGLTVFRDQQFTADMISAPVKRIQDVRVLRNVQFPEDNGPMAHPVRPDSYIEINNFYTVTVYEKGAEVIRMLHTLLGREAFVKGVQRYLEQFDGQAATCDDFVAMMEEVSSRDLGQFKNWYTQAGTPRLTVKTEYDSQAGQFILHISQQQLSTPGQKIKEPAHIPLALALFTQEGDRLPLKQSGEPGEPSELIVDVKKEQERLVFEEVSARPVPSLLRNFSAPVNLELDYSDEELYFLMAHDDDPFNRWEAGQRLGVRICLKLVEEYNQDRSLAVPAPFRDAFQKSLLDETITDKAWLALYLTLPSEEYLGEQMDVVDVEAIHAVRKFVRRQLAADLQGSWQAVYEKNKTPGPYRYDPQIAGARGLKNLSLSYLMSLEDDASCAMAVEQFTSTDNMTDQQAAFVCLAHSQRAEREQVIDEFYSKWQEDSLVLDKWLSIQATAPQPSALARVRELLSHPCFSIKNPNKVRALIGSFVGGNPTCFHEKSGSGYDFLVEQILELDPINSQIAARLAGRMSRWHRYDAHRQKSMRNGLERILAAQKLSKDVFEVASKSLSGS